MWVDGTRNFRLKTVTDHITSKDHLHAVAAWSSDQRSIKGAVDKEMKNKRDAISLALQTCYWLATEELPNAKFKSLLNFLRVQDMSHAKYLLRGGNARYDSLDIFNQMLVCLSGVIEELVVRDVRGSPYWCVFCIWKKDISVRNYAIQIRF